MSTTTDDVLDNSMLVRQFGYNSGTPHNLATYLLGPRGPEYRRDDVGQTVRWYIYDGLGSVLGEVDPSGNVTAFRKYDVYGSVRSGQSGTSPQKFVGALGHTSEDSTGLIYMRARYMDPVTGRFVSEDPGRHGGNWFVYCCNSPADDTDPDGRMPFGPIPINWWALRQLLRMYTGGLVNIDDVAFKTALQGLDAKLGRTAENPGKVAQLFEKDGIDVYNLGTDDEAPEVEDMVEDVIEEQSNVQEIEGAAGEGGNVVVQTDEIETDESVEGL